VGAEAGVAAASITKPIRIARPRISGIVAAP
jgi:hypothetical protein